MDLLYRLVKLILPNSILNTSLPPPLYKSVGVCNSKSYFALAKSKPFVVLAGKKNVSLPSVVGVSNWNL